MSRRGNKFEFGNGKLVGTRRYNLTIALEGVAMQEFSQRGQVPGDLY